MGFNELLRTIGDKELPLMGTNSTGETVIIEGDKTNIIVLTTVQKNGWCRINEYYSDGTTTETYER